MYDWQERTAMLVGEEMLEHFRNSTVAVIGVGGVGGYAAEMIVRAGVGHLIILDSDDVSLTNKNRQLLALDSTIGRSKCDVLAERLNPQAKGYAFCFSLSSFDVESRFANKVLSSRQASIGTPADKSSGAPSHLIKHSF